MDFIQFNLKDLRQRSEIKKSAPHERSYWCDEIAKMINRPIKTVLGLTRDWTLEMIKDSYLNAKSAKSPQKYWWWYRKQTNL